MTAGPLNLDWIAVDWGSSHLRVWAMDHAGHSLASRRSDKGMSVLSRDGFEAALLDLVSDWLGTAPVDVMACGMVGSRQGWVEAPYQMTPCAPLAETVKATTTDPRLKVRVLRGIAQNAPADVMRGEETQIAGYLSRVPNFDGTLCLPGTHTKWVQISAGEVVSFRTFMTGEMFALLSTQSMLRHGITGGWDQKSFLSGVDASLSRPEGLAGRLFTLRAEGLLHDLPGANAKAHLSGLLIGAEIAAAKPYWLGQPVVLLGDAALSAHYATALDAQGAASIHADAEAMTLAGLCAAHSELTEATQ